MKVAVVAAAAVANVAAPVQAAAAASNNIAGAFPARILAAHNAARAEAGAPPMAWDDGLGQAAATYAMQLALTNNFQHSDRHARPGVGENLWMGTRGYYSYERMIAGWASEKQYFASGVFPSVSRSGNWEDVAHYTQMIWPTTTRVGCAVASNATTDYLVCRYSPAGNIDGRAVSSTGSATVGANGKR